MSCVRRIERIAVLCVVVMAGACAGREPEPVRAREQATTSMMAIQPSLMAELSVQAELSPMQLSPTLRVGNLVVPAQALRYATAVAQPAVTPQRIAGAGEVVRGRPRFFAEIVVDSPIVVDTLEVSSGGTLIGAQPRMLKGTRLFLRNVTLLEGGVITSAGTSPVPATSLPPPQPTITCPPCQIPMYQPCGTSYCPPDTSLGGECGDPTGCLEQVCIPDPAAEGNPTCEPPGGGPVPECGPSLFTVSGFCDPTNCDPAPEDAAWVATYGSFQDPLGLVGPRGDVLRPAYCYYGMWGPDDIPDECVTQWDAWPGQPGGRQPAEPALVSVMTATLEMCSQNPGPGEAPDVICSGGLVCEAAPPATGEARHCSYCVGSQCDRVDIGPSAADGETDVWLEEGADEGPDPCPGFEVGDWRVSTTCEQGSDTDSDPAGDDDDAGALVETPDSTVSETSAETLQTVFDSSAPDSGSDRSSSRDQHGIDPVSRALGLGAPPPVEDGDPVTLGSGELVYRTTDLAMPDSGALPMAFTRTYRSRGSFAGRLGRNWEHNFEERIMPIRTLAKDDALPHWCYLSLPYPNCVYHFRGDGGSDLYLYDMQRRAYVPEAGAFGIMTTARARDREGRMRGVSYRLRSAAGVVTEFDRRGLLVRKTAPSGFRQAFLRDGKGRLSKVIDDHGRWLAFRYGHDSLPVLETVTDPSGRRIEFNYQLFAAQLSDDVPPSDRYQYVNRDFTFAQARAALEGAAAPPSAGPVELAPSFVDLRMKALLRRVDVHPAPALAGQVEPAEPVVMRHTYSDVPARWDFRKALAREVLSDQAPTALVGACSNDQEQNLDAQVIELLRRHFALEGKLTRVERQRGAGERLTGTAVRMDGVAWVVELENAYEWDVTAAALGRVASQRYGGDAGLYALQLVAVPINFATVIGVNLVIGDTMVTSLPRFRFGYHLDAPGFSRLDAGARSVLDGLAVADAPCTELARQVPRFQNDLVAITVDLGDSGLLAAAPRDRRAERQRALAKVCAVVSTTDRAGGVTHYALNYMGHPLRILTPSEAGLLSWRGSYNADGMPILEIEPDGRTVQRQFEADLAAPPAFPKTPENPLARGNLRTLVELPGAASNPAAISAQFVSAAAERRTTLYYEPLTNAVRKVIDPAGQITEIAFEYQESSGALAVARAHLARFKIADSVFKGVPLYLRDLNADGATGWARPLVIWVQAPAHVLAGSATARRTVTARYDGHGNLVGSVGADAAHVESLVYDEASPALDAECAAGRQPCALASWIPLPGPTRNGGGGFLASHTVSLDQTASAQELGLPARRSLTTRWSVDASGAPVRRTAPDGAEETYRHDGHGRLALRVDPAGATHRRAYDPRGRVIAATSQPVTGEPYAQRRFYDAMGEPIAACTELAAGGCDGPLNTLIAQRAAGDVRALLETMRRDGEARPIETVSPELRGAATSYGADGRLLSTRFYDARTPATSLMVVEPRYDSYGRAIGEAVVGGPGGERIETLRGLDGFGATASEQAPEGDAVAYQRDSRGLLRAATLLGSDRLVHDRVEVERDGAGLVTRMKSWYLRAPRSNLGTTGVAISETVYERDAAGRVSRTIHPDGVIESAAHASDGALAIVALGSGERSALYRDPVAREVRVRRSNGSWLESTTVEHDWAGRTVTTLTERGDVSSRSTLSYDGLGRPLAGTDAAQTPVARSYDRAGRVVAEATSSMAGGSALDDTVSYTLDRDGLVVGLLDPAQRSLAWSYDGLGRVLTHRAPGARGVVRTWRRSYDALGRTTESAGDDVRTSYTHQPGTARVTAVNSGADALHYVHDPIGQVRQATRLQSGGFVIVDRALDGRGGLLAETIEVREGLDVRAGVTTWERDDLGRPVRRVDPSGLRADLVYDAGRPARVDHPAVTLSAPGGATWQSRALSIDATWQGGALLSEAVSLDGAAWFQRGHARDGGGQLRNVDYTRPAAPARFASQVVWPDSAGRLATGWTGTSEAWPSAETTLRGDVRLPTYDGLGRLAGLRSATGVVAPDAALTAGGARAWAGAVTHHESLLERNQVGTLLGDVLDQARIWVATLAIGSPAVASVSERLSGTIALTWGAEDRLESAGERRFTWNDAGDLATARATMVTPGAVGLPVSEQRLYDAFGRVVRLRRGEGTVLYAYDGGEVTEERSTCGLRLWAQGPGGPLAYRILWSPSCAAGAGESPAIFDLTSARAAQGRLDFGLITDRRGDAFAVIGESGALVEEVMHGAHGDRRLRDRDGRRCTSTATLPCASSWGNPLGFAGARLSPVSGLYQMGARQYDPHLRQFLSRDPLGYVDGFDPWQYAAGDPLNNVDPTGMASQSVAGGDSSQLVAWGRDAYQRRFGSGRGDPGSLEADGEYLGLESERDLYSRMSIPGAILGVRVGYLRWFDYVLPVQRNAAMLDARLMRLHGDLNPLRIGNETYYRIVGGRPFHLVMRENPELHLLALRQAGLQRDLAAGILRLQDERIAYRAWWYRNSHEVRLRRRLPEHISASNAARNTRRYGHATGPSYQQSRARGVRTTVLSSGRTSRFHNLAAGASGVIGAASLVMQAVDFLDALHDGYMDFPGVRFCFDEDCYTPPEGYRLIHNPDPGPFESDMIFVPIEYNPCPEWEGCI